MCVDIIEGVVRTDALLSRTEQTTTILLAQRDDGIEFCLFTDLNFILQ